MMPPKPEHELTQVEVTLLTTAARLMTAAHIFAAHPPGLTHQIQLVGKVKDEIVRLQCQIPFYIPTHISKLVFPCRNQCLTSSGSFLCRPHLVNHPPRSPGCIRSSRSFLGSGGWLRAKVGFPTGAFSPPPTSLGIVPS